AIGLVHTKETRVRDGTRHGEGLLAQVGVGLRFIARHPILRLLTGATTFASLALAAYQALVIVFLARTVGLSSALIGALLAAGSAGGIVGAAVTTSLSKRIGTARALWLSTIIAFPFGLLIPLTQPGWGLAAYVIGAGVLSAGITSFNVTARTFDAKPSVHHTSSGESWQQAASSSLGPWPPAA
ncbi:MAG: MFS transporter, partial [Streptosporangiaceae bacterium]